MFSNGEKFDRENEEICRRRERSPIVTETGRQETKDVFRKGEGGVRVPCLLTRLVNKLEGNLSAG